jgi:hypothetical protein
MRDMLGNVIHEGSLLWWLPKSIPIRVARIEPGGVLTMGEKEVTPDKLVLELTIPVRHTVHGAETQIADFICIINPDAEAVIDNMLKGKPTQ